MGRLTLTSFRHFIYASCPGRRVVGQGNVNILQHLKCYRRSVTSSKLFLNLTIQLYLNNVANHYQLTSQSRPTTTYPTT